MPRLPAAEMKHGPIALVDKDMPIVFIATHHQLYHKIISNMEEIRSPKRLHIGHRDRRRRGGARLQML